MDRWNILGLPVLSPSPSVVGIVGLVAVAIVGVWLAGLVIETVYRLIRIAWRDEK